MKTRRVTERGISWLEVMPPTQPAVDQPIRPLVPQGQPELALSLYRGDDPAPRDSQRRRRVDALLEQRGLRPRPL